MQAGVDFQRHTAAEVRARCPNVLVTDD
eukprot:COSAG06_NODE_48794_length_329_cov_1.200000_2_plen_27_part_01